MVAVNVLLSGRLKLDGYGQGHPENGDGTFHLALGNGCTVQDAIHGMGIPADRVTVTMLNGRKCHSSSSLRAGDRVILIPEDVAALWSFLGRQNFGMDTVFDF